MKTAGRKRGSGHPQPEGKAAVTRVNNRKFKL
jgi:hypothetical protein